MDLADELLLDLEGGDDFDADAQDQAGDEEEAFAVPALPAVGSSNGKRKASELDLDEDMNEGQAAALLTELPEGGVMPAQEADSTEIEEMNLLKTSDVGKIARLFSNKSFQEALTVRLLCLYTVPRMKVELIVFA